jgi:hypothetical protein
MVVSNGQIKVFFAHRDEGKRTPVGAAAGNKEAGMTRSLIGVVIIISRAAAEIGSIIRGRATRPCQY